MSLTFKFDEKKNAEETRDPTEESGIEKYNEEGFLRYIMFEANSGKRSTQYYSWLSGVQLDAEKKEINLSFGENQVVLKGQNLDVLFEEISKQVIKKITPTNKRYTALNGKSSYIVTEVFLK